MEAAGLVLGAIVLVKPVCVSIHDTLSSYRGFSRDAERLRLRFAVQQARLDSFERVLFENGKFAPAMPGRLIDHLPDRTCTDVLALLRQLYAVLVEYAAVRAQYGLQARADDDTVDPSTADADGTLVGPSPDDRLAALSFESRTKGDGKAQQHQKSIGWARKMLWVAIDKSSTEKLVTEFEAWAERTQILLEAVWWPLSFFETVERMRRLEVDADAKSVGLLRGIGLRKLLAEGSSAGTTKSESQSRPREAAAADFCPKATIGALELGQLLTDSGQLACVVEYKHRPRKGSAAITDDAIRQRVLQLAALLHEAPASDPDLRVLQCTNYFEDVTRSRFGLVYASLPLNVSAEHDRNALKPVTLSAVLDAAYPGSRPSLCARMRLAHRIALCVRRLHAYSWVHKSLRCENVLLFPEPQPGSESGSEEKPGGPPPPYSLEDPRIVGFEYARHENDFSDQFGEMEIRRNIYRHPSRWGQPTNRFEKLHDLYALGVLLLELALWSRADQLDKGILLSGEMAADPQAVKRRLLKHARLRLPFYAGDRFADVVVGCLEGTWKGVGVVEGFGDMVGEIGSIIGGL